MSVQAKVITVNALSLFDAFSTLFLIQIGASNEANPVMAGLIQAGPLQFVAVKTLLTLGATVLCWKLYGRLRNARLVLNVGMVSYMLLTAWHGLLLWSLSW